MDITKYIKDARKDKGLSQADMADRLNMERSNYSRLENRGEELSIKQIQQIAKALNMELFELIFPEQAENNNLTHKALMEVIKREQALLTERGYYTTMFNTLMRAGLKMQGMGLNEEEFKEKIDPDGKLKDMLFEEIERAKGELAKRSK